MTDGPRGTHVPVIPSARNVSYGLFQYCESAIPAGRGRNLNPLQEKSYSSCIQTATSIRCRMHGMTSTRIVRPIPTSLTTPRARRVRPLQLLERQYGEKPLSVS